MSLSRSRLFLAEGTACKGLETGIGKSDDSKRAGQLEWSEYSENGLGSELKGVLEALLVTVRM